MAANASSPIADTTVIRHLEDVLARLLAGEAYAKARESIRRDIGEKKRAITASKPLASQLASASGALDRAHKC